MDYVGRMHVLSGIKTAVFVTVTAVILVIGYAAFQTNTENRSKAAKDGNCKGGTLPMTKIVPKFVTKENGEKKLVYERQEVCVEKKDKKALDTLNAERRANEKKSRPMKEKKK